MAHYKTYQTKVLKLNSTQAEAIATSESQFTIRGRGHAKTKRSRYIGNTIEIPAMKLDEIKSKLKSHKRKYFELEVSTFGGMSPEERAKKQSTSGRKPTNTAKPISSTRYLCEIKDDGAFVKAVVV